MINNTTLVGRITKTPETNYTNGGVAVTKFTVAVERNYTNQNGERETDFIRCIAFRQTAENIQKLAVKGSLIGIVGRIQTGSYQNNEGRTVYTTDIAVNNFQMLEPKSVTDQRRQQANQNVNNEMDSVFSSEQDASGFNSEDWPFA